MVFSQKPFTFFSKCDILKSDEQSRDENVRFASTSGGYSATGANPDIPAFSRTALNNHWGGERDHSKEYAGFTKTEYAKRALELVRSPVGDNIQGYKAANGAIVRYDESTNDYVKGFSTGIATMFKPTDRGAYFERQFIRDDR